MALVRSPGNRRRHVHRCEAFLCCGKGASKQLCLHSRDVEEGKPLIQYIDAAVFNDTAEKQIEKTGRNA